MTTNIRQLAEKPFVEFLAGLMDLYPEMHALLGAAVSSPEGNQTLKSDAIVFKVAPDAKVDPTAVEFERTALGLRCLQAALQNNHTVFPKLSAQSFSSLVSFTNKLIVDDADLQLVIYQLACNDLGKTQRFADIYRKKFGVGADDHDKLLAALVSSNDADLFPGLVTLPRQSRQLYCAGLEADLNLGQYVQGENLPANLQGMQAIAEKARNLRLLAELFDFAGVTGAVNSEISLVMTDDNLWAFESAIQELMNNPRHLAYQRYIALRAKRAGIRASKHEEFALGRLAAMLRLFTRQEGQVLQAAWDTCDEAHKATLIEELNVSGCDRLKGILVYYSPALAANMLKSKGDLASAIAVFLPTLSYCYSAARKSMGNSAGNGVYVYDVNDLAKMVTSTSAEAVQVEALRRLG